MSRGSRARSQDFGAAGFAAWPTGACSWRLLPPAAALCWLLLLFCSALAFFPCGFTGGSIAVVVVVVVVEEDTTPEPSKKRGRGGGRGRGR